MSFAVRRTAEYRGGERDGTTRRTAQSGRRKFKWKFGPRDGLDVDMGEAADGLERNLPKSPRKL